MGHVLANVIPIQIDQHYFHYQMIDNDQLLIIGSDEKKYCHGGGVVGILNLWTVILDSNVY